MMNTTILTISAISFYSFAIILQSKTLVRYAEIPSTLASNARRSLFYFIFGFLAIIAHGTLLHHWIDTTMGQNLSLVNLFSLVAWLVALLTLLVALTKPVLNLTLFIFPVALLSIMLRPLFPGISLITTANHPKELFHILLSTIAFSVLCISAFQALLLAIQEYLLRRKQAVGFIQILPPLQVMERLLFQMIAAGFIFLTIVLATSIWSFGEMVMTMLWQKTLLSLFAWAIFAMLLVGRRYFGWRGRLAIRYTLSGVFLVMLAYFGSEFI